MLFIDRQQAPHFASLGGLFALCVCVREREKKRVCVCV